MITREEFDRLLTECMDTYAEAVKAHAYRESKAEYERCVEAAALARAALTKAVYP